MSNILDNSIFYFNGDKFRVNDKSTSIGYRLAKRRYSIVMWKNGWNEVKTFEPEDLSIDNVTKSDICSYAKIWIENNWKVI